MQASRPRSRARAAAVALKLPLLSNFLFASVRGPCRLPPAVPAFRPLPLAGQPCSPLRLPAPLLQASSPCPLGGAANVDGESPLLSDLLADSCLEPPLSSRMP